jgi:pantothenate kinase
VSPRTATAAADRAEIPVATDYPALLDRARELMQRPGRAILGIAGPPAAGKSTLAEQLTADLGPRAALLPMDGYHLSNEVLVSLGSRGRKGAADTFDAAGYAALLRRLRHDHGEVPETVYAPRFHREIEESIAAEISIGPDVELIVTEGNYLLLPQGPWAVVRPLLDEAWYIDIEDETRMHRLIRRHVEFGKSSEEAYDWAHGTDQANATLISSTAPHADLIVRLPAQA